MARYKVVDMSPRLLPVDLHAQLVPGSFAHALHHMIDRLDLSAFDAHYRNDAVGASAHAPAMLPKAVLLAYSQGMINSRSIERACRDNVLFIALTGDAKPHFTTIGRINCRGDAYLRTLLIQSARSSLQRAKAVSAEKSTPEQIWIRTLAHRLPFGKVLVAIANKHARQLWAMLVHDEIYDADAWLKHPIVQRPAGKQAM